MKFIIIVTLLFAFSVCTEVKASVEEPAYETPTIARHDSPLDITFNHRLDMLNVDSKTKRAAYEAGKKKTSMRANLAREFTTKALSDWLDHLGSQNLNMMGKGEFVDDVANLKGFAKLLQNHIIGRSNSIMDKLALLDLKLKQQKLIEQEIEGIKQHPGNISSNLGLNLPWKERLEELVNNAASVHSEFDVALNGICNVIRKINLFVKTMDKTRIDSTKIHQPGPEEIYYPNDHTVLPNTPTFHHLGPKAGHFNNRNPLHNLNKKHQAPLVHKKVHKAAPTKKILKKQVHVTTHKTHSKKVPLARKVVSKEIKKQILPQIKKEISKTVKQVVQQPSKALPGHQESPKSILDSIIQEEASIEKIPIAQAKPVVTKAIKKEVQKVAKVVATKTAKKIAASKVIRKTQKVIQKTLNKIASGKKITKQDKKQIKRVKKNMLTSVASKVNQAKKQIVKVFAAPKVHTPPIQGKAAAVNIVKQAAVQAVQKISPKKINQKVQKALKKVVTKKTVKKLAGLDDKIVSIPKTHGYKGNKLTSSVTHAAKIPAHPAKVVPLKPHVIQHKSTVQKVNKPHPTPISEKVKLIRKEIKKAQSNPLVKQIQAAKTASDKQLLNKFAPAQEQVVKHSEKIPSHAPHVNKVPKKAISTALKKFAVPPKLENSKSQKISKKVAKVAKKAKTAANNAKAFAAKAIEIAKKQPNNPVVQQTRAIAIKNARTAIHAAKVAVKDAKHAKKINKAVAKGTVNAKNALGELKALKKHAKKSVKKAVETNNQIITQSY